MKNLLVASAVALLLGTSGAALADTYVSVLGGRTFAPGLNVNGTKFGMDTGFNVGARIGTSLDKWNLPNFSLEADGLSADAWVFGSPAAPQAVPGAPALAVTALMARTLNRTRRRRN